jgi:poly(3-hydroxybutyrate) depolymerase
MRKACSLVLGLALVPGVLAGVITDGYLVTVPRNLRTPVPLDPVALAIARGETVVPGAPEGLAGRAWTPVRANAEGWFEGRELTYGFVGVTVNEPRERVALLRAAGHGMAYVNGVPRAGDVYAYGYVTLPVRLRAGANHLLFSPGRGRLRVEITEPKQAVFFDVADSLLPDLSSHVRWEMPAAVNVVNTTGAHLTGAILIVRYPNGSERWFAAGPVPRESVRKLRFGLDPTGPERFRLILKAQGVVLDSVEMTVRRRDERQAFRATFVSGIDGSAQYYGVLPPTRPAPGQALFLSLHGAGVEAINQAEAYAPKSWGWLIAPTNRRPFGFNWEDIGRLDALEVLEHARRAFGTDPSRTYLTGHSMGGHGTWHLGALYPGMWGAIAPSAGWISYWSYAGGATYAEGDAAGAILRRAANASDTLALVTNLAQVPAYILHGDADDNVPVSESRTMRAALEPLNPDLRWHEERGAGHWWDDPGPEPGVACVDWPGFFDLFAQRRIPQADEVRNVDFATFCPGVSSRMRWASIEQQKRPWLLSRVRLRADPHVGRIVGTTENVRMLGLDTLALAPGESVTVELDGQAALHISREDRVYLVRSAGVWRPSQGPNHVTEKWPVRSGSFKDVFRNRVAFVYGTRGTPEENAWAFAAARFHAEVFAYIGNGSVDVLPDTARVDLAGRNVLLYGNARTNRLWDALIGPDEVRVEPGSVRVGARSWTGTDLACLVIRPRRDDLTASVAAISGAGLTGMRAAWRMPLFTAGAAIPDLVVLSADYLERGTAGVRLTGFFGYDWSVATGDWAPGE